jgi:hypothetical protein
LVKGYEFLIGSEKCSNQTNYAFWGMMSQIDLSNVFWAMLYNQILKSIAQQRSRMLPCTCGPHDKYLQDAMYQNDLAIDVMYQSDQSTHRNSQHEAT